MSAIVGWCTVYSIMPVLAAERSTIEVVPCKTSPTDFLPSVQAVYDGHSHLDRWSVEVGKREALERLAALTYKTVTSYCFCKWWLDSKKQEWWHTSRVRLKQFFGVSHRGIRNGTLSRRTYEDLKMYVQRVNYVAVGEIGLNNVRARQDKGRNH